MILIKFSKNLDFFPKFRKFSILVKFSKNFDSSEIFEKFDFS